MLLDSDIIQKAKTGDKKSIGILITKMQPLIASIVQRITGSKNQHDLMQEGVVAVLEAIRSYSEVDGASFCTFAHLCAYRWIMTCHKREMRFQACHEEWKEELDDKMVYKDVALEMNEALQRLREKERFVVESYFGLNGLLGECQEGIGKRLVVSKQRVSQILNNALFKLKILLEETDEI